MEIRWKAGQEIKLQYDNVSREQKWAVDGLIDVIM